MRRCGSGDLVVSHYDHVRFVADAGGTVEGYSASDLASLDVEGSEYGIPRLDDVLDAIPAEVGVNVELKERDVAEDAVAAVQAVDNDVVVSSLFPDALWRVRLLDESITLASDFDVRLTTNLDTADALDCEYANPHWSLCLATDVVERAHDAGMAVHAWPVGSKLIAAALVRRGVDGLIASRPI